MIEILPIRLLTDEDASIFGALNVSLGKLERAGLSVGEGVVITPPELRLKTVLEHYDFGTKEIFEQNLTLVKKEINSTPVPQILEKELKQFKKFYLNQQIIKSKKELWQMLLNLWLDEIKQRLWQKGFFPGISQNLEPQVVIFLKNLENFGTAFFDPLQDDVMINIKKGKLHPNDQKKIFDIVKEANKKLFIPYEYEWILDKGVRLVKVSPFTPNIATEAAMLTREVAKDLEKKRSTFKVFLDLSVGLTIEKDVDGIYISSEKIFDLNKPNESFENLVFKLVESATTFANFPILFKLADKSEGMGKIRGSLRLLHQASLLDPLIESLDFVRHKKNLLNVHIVIPFVRNVRELMQIKRELAIKKLMRKNSLQIWLEICTPENIINLDEYLLVGVDGVVLNLDELISHLNGFDPKEEELAFYKHQVEGLIKFLADGIRLLHKSKIPILAFGSVTLNPRLLEFLVEKGVYGVVVDRYEAHSASDLLHQVEKRIILRMK